jgi:hypothetical protein
MMHWGMLAASATMALMVYAGGIGLERTTDSEEARRLALVARLDPEASYRREVAELACAGTATWAAGAGPVECTGLGAWATTAGGTVE